MVSLSLENLKLGYKDNVVVSRLNLHLSEGELGCLLGASGCGKSTILRAIAGFVKILDGQIKFGDQVIATSKVSCPPQQRNVGLVFQDIALFPHLNIAKNIQFGLHRWSSADRAARLNELLTLVNLNGLQHRYPHELSGGQQQRVALARALAPKPKILLLDEPFSGLDAALRTRLTQEVRAILRQSGTTGLLVTHDQKDAFDFADRVAVMRNGEIEQVDGAYELYHQPKNRFVAQFVGPGDVISARVVDVDKVDCELGRLISKKPIGRAIGDQVELLFRPDDLIHDEHSPLKPVLTEKCFRGSYFLYRVRFPSGIELGCLAPSHHNHRIGDAIGVRLELEHLVVLS